jgi:hypothetical protein
VLTRRNLLGIAAGALAGRALPACEPAGPRTTPRDLVVGAGGWCWFQSPRACVDGRDRLWLGSSQGIGAPTPGSVDVTSVDLASLTVVSRRSLATDRVDDHTSPSVLAVEGQVQVAWAAHRRTDWIEIGTADGPMQRIGRPASTIAPGRGISYGSAHLVGGERWLLYRGERFSWNLLTSPDGQRWSARGLVVVPPAGGQRPYVLAASDGGRLHLLVSDGNPTERRGTSIFSATIDAAGVITTGNGRPVGAVGATAPHVGTLTRVIGGEVGADEAHDTDAWLVDLRIHRGRPHAILSVRDPRPPGEGVGVWRHRYLRVHADARGQWQVEHLAWAGSELYANQPDYTGLATLDPTDPDRVVTSSDVHPATGAVLRSNADGQPHHELHEGRRASDGSWSWTALTADSIEDHLRPILVDRPGHAPVLAWMRGSYRSWRGFATAIVVRTHG